MADGRTLIFSSNRPGGYGGFDMFQSTLNDLGEWQIPYILDYVNTDKDDQLPCISAQGDLMYYTYNNNDIYSVVIPPKLRQFMNNIVQGYILDVDTKGGIGAEIIVTDALTSERVMSLSNNPSDGRYTIVLPVGRSFNIEFKKEGYSSFTHSMDLRNKHAYEEIPLDVELFKSIKLNLVVNDVDLFEPILARVKIREKGQHTFIKDVNNNPRTGRFSADLDIGKNYEVFISAEHFKSEIFELNASGLVIYREFDKYIDLAPEKLEVMIAVADLMNNSKVKSKVIIRNKSRDEIIEVEGNQLVSLRAGDRYEVEVTSDQGYAFNSTSIDLTSGKAQNINVPLQKLEKNTKLTLKDITFESNSDKLSDISFEELNRVIKLMKENPSLKVEIAAHTDDVGSDIFNLTLSDKRAESVVDYLSQNDIPSERFVARGYGESQAKFANDSDENRAKNRRVELIIVSI
ncbi:MAG: OmpA family protein [Flammeovirgaceae bacterium]|nr:OmpA family protein [Flammeovirgaceae bacterium]